MKPTTFAAGMACGHPMSTLVRTEGFGTFAPREVYKCATPGCDNPEFMIDVTREAEACGFAPEGEDG